MVNVLFISESTKEDIRFAYNCMEKDNKKKSSRCYNLLNCDEIVELAMGKKTGKLDLWKQLVDSLALNDVSL